MTNTTTPVERPVGGTTALTIWMADDSRDDHLLMVLAAEEAGLRADFTFVDDGSSLVIGLAGLKVAELPDLLVVDLHMPGMRGTQTLQRLRSHPVLCDVPVVVFTASDRPADEAATRAVGAQWFVTKPRSFRGLVEFVASFPRRVAQVPKAMPLDQRSVADLEAQIAALSGDVVAEVEDYLLGASARAE